jgi:hypothetical protein
VSSSIAFCPNEPSPCRQMTWASGLAALAPTAKRQSHTHRAEPPGIETVAGDKGRDRLMAQFKLLLPIDNEGPGVAPGLASVTSQVAKRRPER